MVSTESSVRPVALMLPGQGAQHEGMAVQLYGRVPVFTAVLDELFTLLGEQGEWLRSEWLRPMPSTPLDDAALAQPLLFAIEYALGRDLLARGVRPAVLVGHSVGELVAATLAGVFSPADAARMLSGRAAATADAPLGGMLAVSATPEELAGYLDDPRDPDGVVIGARNAPRQTVLAGPRPRLATVATALTGAGIVCRPVRARQPFHSPAMAQSARRFEEVVRRCAPRPPSIPIISTRTARPLRRDEALDAAFWAGQLATPVLFWPALDQLLAGGRYTLVDSGPSQGLAMLARRHPAVRRGESAVVSMLPVGAAHALDCWTAAVSVVAGAGGSRREGC